MEWLVVSMGALNILLALLFVVMNLFWAREVQTLTNKLMSRDYTGYVQATKPPPPARLKLPDGELEDLGTLPRFGIP